MSDYKHIVIDDGDIKLKASDRVISIGKGVSNSKFYIAEACDDCFAVCFDSKEDIIGALNEMIDAVNKMDNKGE